MFDQETIIAIIILLLIYRFVRRTKIRKENLSGVKTLSEMPGPRSFPIVGTLPYYFLKKKYSMDRLHWNGKKKFAEFGWIVRENIVHGVNIVWVFHPVDIRQVFESEGRYPSRRSHVALKYFREKRPHKYNTAGLLPTNGPEWSRIRNGLQRPVMSATATSVFLPGLVDITNEFINYLHQNIDVINSTDIVPHLEKVMMEITGYILFDEHLHSIQEPLMKNALPARLIKAAGETNDNILITDNGLPLWKIFGTQAYRTLSRSQESIEEISVMFLKQKLERMEFEGEEENKTLLDRWLTSKFLDHKDIMTGIAEFLLAGVHTTSYTMAFLLYHLANNNEAQEKLRNEVISIMDEQRHIDRGFLSRAVYTRACIKESMRLNPISVGIGRTLPRDTILGGYLVPKDTVVVTQNQVTCRMEEFFERPDDFLPERWIPGSPYHKEYDPFLVLPFGHGPRACIGKSIAESSLEILIIEIIKNFELFWDSPATLDCLSHLINKPDKPVNIRFSPL